MELAVVSGSGAGADFSPSTFLVVLGLAQAASGVAALVFKGRWLVFVVGAQVFALAVLPALVSWQDPMLWFHPLRSNDEEPTHRGRNAHGAPPMPPMILLMKALHVLSATIFFGAGLMSAFWKFRGDQSGDPRVIDWAQKQVVLADWVFTVPSGVISPLTGAYLVSVYGLSWTTPWVLASLGGYLAAMVLWLPAAWIQIELRKMTRSSQAARSVSPLESRVVAARRAGIRCVGVHHLRDGGEAVPVGLVSQSLRQERFEVGSGSFLNSFFSTVGSRLEQSRWGSRFPVLQNQLFQGHLEFVMPPKLLPSCGPSETSLLCFHQISWFGTSSSLRRCLHQQDRAKHHVVGQLLDERRSTAARLAACHRASRGPEHQVVAGVAEN
jgi:uncharacterized membrane protein